MTAEASTVGRIGRKNQAILDEWKTNASKQQTKEQKKVRKMGKEEIENMVTWEEYETEQREVGQFDKEELETGVGKNNTLQNKEKLNEQKTNEQNENEQVKQEIKILIEEEVSNESLHINVYVKSSNWQKDKTSQWLRDILEKVGEIFTESLPTDKVYKYAIDVSILQSAALSRQSETVMTPSTDFAWNLKIKNGNGITVVLNAYAFQVAIVVDNEDDEEDDDATPMSPDDDNAASPISNAKNNFIHYLSNTFAFLKTQIDYFFFHSHIPKYRFGQDNHFTVLFAFFRFFVDYGLQTVMEEICFDTFVSHAILQNLERKRLNFFNKKKGVVKKLK
ncbi:hypothetical protein RFI_31145 [Reticulomyxa filosa]|uniref:Uncharacterized protein n=1 Tax=Reticulomyxa filosa TaxID=46433 RepID=X6LY12_RETFI|nr:hypothetical protein RFI_31145 [Reticulomyxa filosa]|eukprot:ETO06251.1 hypothetical protein RFI_31145 [Reticulomyxa filosa]